MKNIVILYHKDCSDGFGGAWAAWKKFGNQASYISLRHQEPVLRGLNNKKIFMIDFTYPIEIMEKLIRDNELVTSIDHHETAEKAVKLTENHLFSLKHSGAVLAWNYFHPRKAVPRILKYVEDMDLWKFKIPYTKEILAHQNLFDFNFKLWDKFAQDLENNRKRAAFVHKGKFILFYENRLIKQLVNERAELIEFEGYRILAVNSPNFHSQIGNLLAIKKPPFGIVWREQEGVWVISLRGIGKVNLGKLAKKYGGGGHYNAAAFKLPQSHKLPWRFLSST